MPKSKISKLVAAMAMLAVVGFVDAAYLSIAHFSGSSVRCSIIRGCDIVTTSAYSQIFGVPVAVLGAIYYVVVIGLFIAYIDGKKEKVATVMSWVSCVGLLASVYFVSIQAFVIKAFCEFCLLSAIISTTIFVLGTIYLVIRRRKYVLSA